MPTIESEIETRHEAVPLDENEGIYVRDTKTGKVRAIVGQTYMLSENEELWEKHLPEHVQELLGISVGSNLQVQGDAFQALSLTEGYLDYLKFNSQAVGKFLNDTIFIF